MTPLDALDALGAGLDLFSSAMNGSLDALGRDLLGWSLASLALAFGCAYLVTGWMGEWARSRSRRSDRKRNKPGDESLRQEEMPRAPRVPRSTLTRVWERETLPLPAISLITPLAGPVLDGGAPLAVGGGIVFLPIAPRDPDAKIADDVPDDVYDDECEDEDEDDEERNQTTQVMAFLPLLPDAGKASKPSPISVIQTATGPLIEVLVRGFDRASLN